MGIACLALAFESLLTEKDTTRYLKRMCICEDLLLHYVDEFGDKVKFDLSFKDRPWYYGAMSKSKTDHHFKTGVDGDFLVREMDEEYCLSVKLVDHYRQTPISKRDDLKLFLVRPLPK